MLLPAGRMRCRGHAGSCSAPGLGCLHRHKQEKAVLTETDTELVFTVFFQHMKNAGQFRQFYCARSTAETNPPMP